MAYSGRAQDPRETQRFKLYSLTDFQKNFNMNMLALVNGIEPQVLEFEVDSEQFVAHREMVVTRRTRFELKKARDRAHIRRTQNGA